MASFAQTRSVEINAETPFVHGLVNDFHHWKDWSPWEEMDPTMTRTYTGPDSGVGAHYAWAGNNKVGTGTMEITSSAPERIQIALEFLKPFKASNTAVFTLTPLTSGTRVEWTMTGTRGLLMEIGGKLFFDRAIAKDFDRGLAKLKALAEG